MDGTGERARRRRWRWLAMAGVGIAAVSSTAVAWELAADPDASPALCAPGDPNPEPGVQGDVPEGVTPAWDCGVRPIGFLAGANGSMAVAEHCAYTGAGLVGDGVRVIDVSDPTAPELVRVLSTSSRELLAAQVTDERGLLATRRRAEARDGQVLGRDMLVDIWDIFEDCTDPQLLGTVRLPTTSDLFGDPPGEVGGPAHNLKFNPTATKLYGSLPVHEIDLTNLDPSTWTFRNLHCAITEQFHLPHQAVPGLCDQLTDLESPMGAAGGLPAIDHEPSFNPDGSRLYLGGQLPTPDSLQMLVLDMTGPDPVLISETQNAPGHSIDFMTIDGREYLLHANEIAAPTACIPERLRPRFLGFADRAYVLDITDEAAPTHVSEIMLADSRFSQCGPSGGGPSTAYHEVDDPTDTHYAVIGFEAGGFRFFDVRDPAHPTEVAYFNHGRSEHTKSYVIPETGHIWASDANGFWVLELEPQVRAALGLQPTEEHAPVAPAAPAADAEVAGALARRASLPATGTAAPWLLGATLLALALVARRLAAR